ncbi:MAG: SufD family Fe-S cluster assembly protein [Lachnospiraceae bacterium]|nr:SufD family Fe-S cluster assembly protein [Lachnospiraceae bacterium]
MEQILNQPLVNTFSWLHVGATKADVAAVPAEQEISLEEGEERILIFETKDKGRKIKADLEAGSVLHIVELQLEDGRMPAASGIMNDIEVNLRDNAAFHWYRLVIGNGRTYDNCSVNLLGKGSSFTADIGYSLSGEGVYDVNCEAIHKGEETTSTITASGLLSGKARKLLRGTIDLQKGCRHAVGNESEDVLLLSDEVSNQSVPVILCAEEDVVGNHGASIGQPDENLLFYLESRGIPEEQVMQMLSRAKLDAVIRKIPDENIRKRLLGERE